MFGWLMNIAKRGAAGVSSSDDFVPQRANVCMGVAAWSERTGQLEGVCDYLLKFTLLNGRSFIVNGGVENCDSEAVYWRDRHGVLQSTCRRGVSNLEITWKMKGRITHWNWDKHFGFLRTGAGVDYYFDKTSIDCVTLLKDLDLGKTGQYVEFHIKRKSIAGKPPMVTVKGYAVEDDYEGKGFAKDEEGELISKSEAENVACDFRDTVDVASTQIGFVSRWFKEYHYGFLVNGRKSCYFKECDIFDQRLKDSLGKGKIRQQVRYLPMPNRENRETPPVRVIEMLREETQNWAPLPTGDSDYDIGRRLMNDGKLEEAAGCFRKVLNTPDDVCRLSALRDLAETLNRGEPSEESAIKAFDLIEAHRGEFGESEQPRFERMEILYLMKAKRYSDAEAKIKNYLLTIDAEPNQRRYFRSLLKAATEKAAMSQDISEDCSVARFQKDIEKLKALDLTGATFDRIEEFVGQYNECLGDIAKDLLALVDLLRTYAQQVDYENRVNSYAIIKECSKTLQQRLSQLQVDGWTVGPVLVPGLSKMIQRTLDLIENDFCKFVKGKIDFDIGHSGSDAYELSDGDLWLKLRMSTTGPRGLPLENLLVVCDEGGEIGEQHVFEKLVCGESVEFTTVFRPNEECLKDRSGEIHFSISYARPKISKDDSGEGLSEVTLPYSILTEVKKFENKYVQYIDAEAADEYFVGREEYLAKLERQFQSEDGGRMACIYGMHRSGKSSLINRLLNSLSDDYFYPETFNATTLIQVGDPVEKLCKDLIRQVEDELRRRGAWSEQDDLRWEEYATDDWIGKTNDVCRKLKKEGCSVVLRIDEFTAFYDECLRRPGYKATVKAFLNVLKEEFAKKKILYMVLAGQDHMLKFKQMFPAQLVVEPMRLLYLTREDVRQLAEAGLSDDGRLMLDDAAIDELWSLTGGYPKYVQHLLWRITEIVQVVRSIGREDVIKAANTFWSWKEHPNALLKRLDATFFEPFAIFRSEDFDDVGLLELNYRIADLSKESFGWVRVSDVVKSPVDRALLKQLRDRNLVETDSAEETSEEKIRLRVGLFAEYLRHNHNPELTVWDFDSEKGE